LTHSAAHANLRGRIDAVTAETTDAATIRIRVGRGWRGHRAGQYVRGGVDVDGVRQWRTYSITSHATSQTNAQTNTKAKDNRFITITVKTVPDGVVSNYLVREAKAGTLVHLDQACGDFTMPATRPGKVLFVTAGSGITPVMGILRSHLPELADVVVVHSAPTADDVVFGSELRDLADAGSVRLLEHHTATSPRITAADLDALVPDWARAPGLGLRPRRAAGRHRGALGSARCGRPAAHRAVHRACPRRRRRRPISFSRTGSTVEQARAQRFSKAGENAGVLMPFGLPDGRVLRLRPSPSQRCGPRRAQRRRHHRSPRRRRAGADLHLHRRRVLRNRHLSHLNHIQARPPSLRTP